LITNGVHEVHEAAFGPDLFTDYINDFMERHQALPFFVYYPMVLPHKSWVPTPDDPGAITEKERYTAMVAYLDKMVGKIVHKLDELGLREKTLILFTGDNGSSKSVISQVGAELIRGGKGKPTDAGTRVPLIANWPGTIPAGVVNPNIVDFTIFFPTLAEAAGAVTSERFDGQSILDQLRGEPGNPRGWIYMFYYPNKQDHFDEYSSEFVRDVRYKLYGVGRFEGLFFDVQTDVLEQHPIPLGSGSQEAETARIKLQGILANIQAQQDLK
jgi:arylsulfatase A